MTDSMKPIVGIAGLGSMAQFLVDELLAEKYKIVAISRAEREWFKRPGVKLCTTDYSASSIQKILDDEEVDVLFSFVHDNTSFYNKVHEAMLKACQLSKKCKRFVPSESGGDLEIHDDKPRFYIPTHGGFRKVLRQQTEIEWTFNQGWFMDYFLGVPGLKQSYLVKMSELAIWPPNLETRIATIPGTGDEPITWTSGRDTAKAMVRLLHVPKGQWDEHTYVAGETDTWNDAVQQLEKYHGITFKREYIPISQSERIMADADNPKYKDNPRELWTAYMEEWQYSGGSSVPAAITPSQHTKFFSDLTFENIITFLNRVKNTRKSIDTTGVILDSPLL